MDGLDEGGAARRVPPRPRGVHRTGEGLVLGRVRVGGRQDVQRHPPLGHATLALADETAPANGIARGGKLCFPMVNRLGAS